MTRATARAIRSGRPVSDLMAARAFLAQAAAQTEASERAIRRAVRALAWARLHDDAHAYLRPHQVRADLIAARVAINEALRATEGPWPTERDYIAARVRRLRVIGRL